MSGKWYICWKCRTVIHDDDDPDFDDTTVVLLNPTQYAAVAHLLPELEEEELDLGPMPDGGRSEPINGFYDV
tara:strand:+ start:3713 stop:3928 length:216 start_codon:yes stop_codon:yes gene_type:complete